MASSVKLSEVVNSAKLTGHIGWIKIKDASKVVANAHGWLHMANTIFIQNYVEKELNDEILFFGKKQLNITSLERELSSFVGLEVNFYVGGKSFIGILEA